MCRGRQGWRHRSGPGEAERRRSAGGCQDKLATRPIHTLRAWQVCHDDGQALANQTHHEQTDGRSPRHRGTEATADRDGYKEVRTSHARLARCLLTQVSAFCDARQEGGAEVAGCASTRGHDVPSEAGMTWALAVWHGAAWRSAHVGAKCARIRLYLGRSVVHDVMMMQWRGVEAAGDGDCIQSGRGR